MQPEPSILPLTGTTRLSELEASIKSMKTRIESLLKFQSSNQRKIKQTLKSSIHHLGHKIVQVEYSEALKRSKQSDEYRIRQQHQDIAQFRERQNQEFQKIKQTMKEMKRNESDIIKKQSRLNEGIIEENRRKNIESKKENVEKMKEIREETRRSLAQRWKEGNESMLATRRQMVSETRLKEEATLQAKIKQLQRIEKELSSKVDESSQTSKTLHKVAEDTNRMSQIEFYKIIKQVKKQKRVMNQNDLKNQVYQKFLSSRMGETLKGRSTFKSSNNESTVMEKSDREEREEYQVLHQESTRRGLGEQSGRGKEMQCDISEIVVPNPDKNQDTRENQEVLESNINQEGITIEAKNQQKEQLKEQLKEETVQFKQGQQPQTTQQ